MAVDTEVRHFARRVELWAVRRAHKSLDVDKSDEIRIWALARKQQGFPADSDDWKRAYNESDVVQ